MASRNDDLYGAYLNAHIYSGGNCGDLSSGDPRPHRGTWVDFRGNDVKAAVALGQMHGRAGTEALSMERLVAMVDGMVAWDPTRGGVDLSAAKAAMKNVADAGKAANEAPPNAGDLADMKAATQGLGVVGETSVERVVTDGGVTEQRTFFPLPVYPAMGDVWEPRLGGPPITLLFHDPTCGPKGAWRTGHGDEEWITTDALCELYQQKFTVQGRICSRATAMATWAAVRAKITYPARVADLVVTALGENAKMSEIKAAVAALALSEKSAASAK